MALTRLESILFSPNPRTAALGLAALIGAGGLLATLLVAAAGPIYALAAFFVVVGGLLVLRDLRWGLAALIAVIGLLPFAALPFKLGFTPTFLDVTLLAVYFVWIVRIATRRHRELVGTPLGAPILAFLLLAVFAFANGLQYNQPTSTTVRNYAELALAILFFFVLVNTLRTQANLDLLTRLIILAGAGAAALAVLFYFIPPAWTVRVLDALARFNYPGGYGALRYIEDDPANPMRAIGTMVDPNVLGGFMILVTALTLPQLVSPQPLFRRPWVALFLGLDLLALYLTHSRGSMAGLAAGLLVIGVLRYRKLLLVGAIAAGLLLFLPQTQTYVAHFVEGLRLQDRATLMRLGEYKDALALIGRYPWFGVGFTGSPEANLYVGVSNLYLLIAEEMGVVGVALFLVIVTGYLGSLWRAWRRLNQAVFRTVAKHGIAPRLEALLLGLAAATIGVMVGGFLDHYLFNLVYPHMSALFWIYVGLGMSATRIARAA
jgi:O-antigen ligase